MGQLSTRAEILHAEGRDKEALEVMNAAVGRREDFASYLLRAQFHEATKQYDLAEADYAHLTEMKDAAAAGYELLGGFYESRGDSARAIATWEAGLKEAPDAVNLQKRLVKAMLGSQKPEMRSRGRAMLEGLLAEHLPTPSCSPSAPGCFRPTRNRRPSGRGWRRRRGSSSNSSGLNPGNVDAHLRLMELARAQWDPAKAQ